MSLADIPEKNYGLKNYFFINYDTDNDDNIPSFSSSH
jgi:hypothetical protein